MHEVRFAALAVVLACMMAPAAHSRTEKVLYSFCQSSGCQDGQDPYSPMVADAHGNLFGTTLAGGNSSNAGTIYELQKVKKTWVFHSLYSFCSQANCADGSWPLGGLILDTSGNLYGTTYLGGSANEGVVYELKKNGTFKALYSFCAQLQCADGSHPAAGLSYQGQQTGFLYDGSSTLYGTTQVGGGKNWGVVYTIAPGEAEAVLYSFGANNNTNDGQGSEAPLIIDGVGDLYGTTHVGGSTGDGTIFGVSPSGSENLLFSFCSQEENDCGSVPQGLFIDANGTMFGTTLEGGSGFGSSGVVYSFAAGSYTTLANFCTRPTCRSGAGPSSALIEDLSGNLFGVAAGGGKNVGTNGGTVFELTGTTLKAIYSFCTQANCTDGANPVSKLVMNGRGALFGVTALGGAFNGGTIFELP